MQNRSAIGISAVGEICTVNLLYSNSLNYNKHFLFRDKKLELLLDIW